MLLERREVALSHDGKHVRDWGNALEWGNQDGRNVQKQKPTTKEHKKEGTEIQYSLNILHFGLNQVPT